MFEGVGRRIPGDADTINDPAENAHHAVEKYRGTDRLDQHILESGFFGAMNHFLATISGHHHHVRHVIEWKFPKSSGRFDAVHAGHQPVDEHDFVRRSLRLGTIHGTNGCFARLGLVDLEAHVAKQVTQYNAGVLVVVHHQHTLALQIARQRQFVLLANALAKARGEPESATLAGFAIYAYFSAHQLGQFLGDNQT